MKIPLITAALERIDKREEIHTSFARGEIDPTTYFTQLDELDTFRDILLDFIFIPEHRGETLEDFKELFKGRFL